MDKHRHNRYASPPDGRTHNSKLNLVDLAGSERMKATGAEGAVAKEALHINKSLSFLAQACALRAYWQAINC